MLLVPSDVLGTHIVSKTAVLLKVTVLVVMGLSLELVLTSWRFVDANSRGGHGTGINCFLFNLSISKSNKLSRSNNSKSFTGLSWKNGWEIKSPIFLPELS